MHKIHLTLLVAWSVGSGVCHAQSTPAPLPSVQTALTATCIACHGAMGEGNVSGVPRLAGKNPEYLAHALTMFKAGTRASPEMQAVAAGLSDSDIQSLSHFFSEQHPPRIKDATPPDASLAAAGRELAEAGAGADIPACFSCHGAGGKGNGARFPVIAGESGAFIVRRLKEFQARAKTTPTGPRTMTDLAAKLSEAQIRQAAAFLSQIDP
ncbi:MAG TPA: c-type cytochrome [Janthinobacterium sp.]|nr:c-type cytochrome [Janthinobacterium sp.]